MNKEQATEILFKIGVEIAEELGCAYSIVEDGDYGLWGKLGERAFGKYKEIILHDGHGRRKGNNVHLTYRFGNPKICIFGRDASGCETLASIELNDGTYENGKYVNTGNWKFSESQVWGSEGVAMLNRLLKMWNERGGE